MKFTEQFNDLMKNNQNSKDNHGKVIGLKQKKEFEKTL